MVLDLWFPPNSMQSVNIVRVNELKAHQKLEPTGKVLFWSHHMQFRKNYVQEKSMPMYCEAIIFKEYMQCQLIISCPLLKSEGAP